MTFFPGVRRNTFSGSGESAGRGEQHNPGERRETRGMDGFESLRQALGENTRDQDDAQRNLVTTYLRELENEYTEPMYLGLPAEPKGGIVLLRIRKFPDDEKPILCGMAVHFIWDPSQSRARITSIDGLSPGVQKYRFNFLVVG